MENMCKYDDINGTLDRLDLSPVKARRRLVLFISLDG